MSAAPADLATERQDRFGNPIDPRVGYARGQVLSDEIAESLRQTHAHGLLRERFRRHGDAGLFNLTGLIRGYPLEKGDEDAMRSYVHFNARQDGELELLAITLMGGDASTHQGFLATRVTAGMLAVMVTLLEPGDRVLSLVAADRSHPSVRQAVTMAGGTVQEFTCSDAFEEALQADPAPRAVVLTAISPSKKHLPAEVIQRCAALARRRGTLVIVDDAHMAARIALYGEAGGLALDADIAIWSLDKHLDGPRAGFVAGRSDLIRVIKARALSLGVEAQLAQYLGGLRAVQAFDPEPIRQAARMSEQALAAINPELEGRAYLAGAGIAIAGEDFLDLVLRRAKRNRTDLVPIEAVSLASMRVLEQEGGVMIPSVGMPGSACTFRIMLYPDGARFGEAGVIAACRTGLAGVVEAVEDPALAARGLLGA